MAENRQYDHEYKVQAVKLAKEIGQAKAAKELGVMRQPHSSFLEFTHKEFLSSQFCL